MPDREKVIKALECCLKESDHLYSNPCKDCPYEGQECIDRMKADALSLLKEQEDLGTELTNAMELVRKKNERIKKLEEQIETLTRWRANAGAFD